jgi:hypothetical protein
VHWREHPLDEREEWKDIDLTFVGGKITKAPYDLFVIEDDNDPGIRIMFRGKGDAEAYGIAVGAAAMKEAEPIPEPLPKGDGGKGEVGEGEIGGGEVEGATALPIKPKLPKPVYEKGKVTWVGVFTDTDVVLQAYPWGIDLYRVVKSDKAPVKFEVVVEEPEEETVARLMPLQSAVDAAGKEVGMVEEETEDGRLETIGDKTVDGEEITYPLKDSVVVECGVASNGDDGYVYGVTSEGVDGTWYQNGLLFGYANPGGDRCYAWVRFSSITIPVGVSINFNSYLSFKAYIGGSGTTVRVDLWGDDAGTPVAPTTTGEYWALTKTTAHTDWDFGDAWVSGTRYSSVSISGVVQELVDSYDYSAGNAMQFMVYEAGSTALAYRNAWDYSYSGETTTLHIEYTMTTVTGCVPGSLNRGDYNEDVVVTGDDFTGATSVSFGSGITVNGFTVDTDEQITANVDVEEDAVVGLRDVTVVALGTAVLDDGFEVTSDAPTVTGINPSQGNQGDTFNVVVTGTNFVEAMDPDLFWATTDGRPASDLDDTFPVQPFDTPYGAWDYRMRLVVDNQSGGALTDYQVRIDLTDDNFPYDHVEGASGEDLRFVEDGVERPYWIEEWNDGGDSTIWVKMESIATGEQDLYVYYGNAGASAGSDGGSTFAWFDGFDGVTLDLTKWQGDTGYATVGSGVLTYTVPSLPASKRLYSLSTFGQGYAFRTRAIMQDADDVEEAILYGFSLADETDLAWFLELRSSLPLDIPKYIVVRNEGAQTGYTSQSPWVYGSYAVWSILRNGATNVAFKVNDVSCTNSPIATNIPDENLYVYLAVDDQTLSMDWVFVRKYVGTEPTVSLAGELYPGGREESDYFGSREGCSSYEDVESEGGSLTLEDYANGNPFWDTFEVSLAKWDQWGATSWARSLLQKYEGSYSVLSTYTTEGWMISDSINLAGYYSGTLGFWIYESAIEWDDARMYFYQSGTATYNHVEYLENMTPVDGIWTYWSTTIDMDLYGNNDFRIAFWSDMEAGESVYIDYLWTAVNSLRPDGYAVSQTLPTEDELRNARGVELDFDGTEPAGTDLKVRLYYPNGGSWVLVPDSVLSGNSAGFELVDCPVDISDVTSGYGQLRLRADLTTSSIYRPELYSWSLSFYYRVFEEPDPIIGIPGEEESIMANGWQWRKPIVIDNSGGAERTDYHVKVEMNTEDLIDEFKIREDGGDVRIFDSDDSTDVDFYIESGMDSPLTTVWVYIPIIPASSEKIIYMRYGNSGVVVNSFSVLSSTQVVANVTIGDEAPPGDRDMSVETPGGWGVLGGCFTVIGVAEGGEVDVASLLLLCLVCLGSVLSFFAWKAHFIVVSLAAALVWLALATVTFVSPDTVGLETLASGWVVLLVTVFVLMSFAMLLMQMRTDIVHEAEVRGHKMSWRSREKPPSMEREDSSEVRRRDYRKRFRKSLAKGRSGSSRRRR